MLKKLLFRNFRLLYKAGRALRSRFTGNGLMILTAAITAGVFGFDTWQTLSHQVFSLLFFIIAVALLCSFGFRNKLTVRRLLPDFATAGQPVRYDLIIENPDDREQVELEVEDQLQTTFPTYAEPDPATPWWFHTIRREVFTAGARTASIHLYTDAGTPRLPEFYRRQIIKA